MTLITLMNLITLITLTTLKGVQQTAWTFIGQVRGGGGGRVGSRGVREGGSFIVQVSVVCFYMYV